MPGAANSSQGSSESSVIPLPGKTPPPEMPGQVHADGEETIVVDTDLYHVVFSNRGAVVRSWVLKAYKDHRGKPLELVNEKALGKVAQPFSLVFKNQAPATDPNNALFRAGRSDGGLNPGLRIFRRPAPMQKNVPDFSQNSYLVQVTSQVTASGTLVPHSLEWRGGFGDQTVNNPASIEHTLSYDLPSSKLKENDVKAAKNGPYSTCWRVLVRGPRG